VITRVKTTRLHRLFVPAIDTLIELRSTVAGVVPGMRRVLANMQPRARSGRARPGCVLRVEPGRAGAMILNRDDEEVLRTTDPAYLLAGIEYELFGVAVRRARKHLLLHAGAAARHGRGVLLPGGPDAGKSTLVAALLGRGFRYFTDENAALSLGTGKLTPLPRPLHLDDRSWELLRPRRTVITRHPYHPSDATRRYARPAARLVARQPVPVGLVAFLRRQPGARARAEPVRPARALAGLMRLGFNSDRMPRAAFETLADLLGTARAVRLHFDAPGDAACLIDRLLRGESSSG